MEKRGTRKAVAPVITTILLILIVLVLAGIIILWAVSFIPEAVAKFGQPIENACSSLSILAQISSSQISVSNTGDIPIYEFGIRQEGAERSDIAYEKVDLGPGEATTLEVEIGSGTDEIDLIPVLLGKTEKGKIQKYSCPEENWQVLGV